MRLNSVILFSPARQSDGEPGKAGCDRTEAQDVAVRCALPRRAVGYCLIDQRPKARVAAFDNCPVVRSPTPSSSR
jgi:hypothetical protein